ncbi:MAG: hypothetical protein ACLPSY_11055 [Steroidobacteraceae bacterium]
MQTLTIKDLPLSEELDSNAMAAMQGGISVMNNTAQYLPLIAYPTNWPTGNGGHHRPGPNSGGGGSYDDGPYGGEDLHEQD